MANFNADQVATLRGKTKADVADNSTDRQVEPFQLGGVVRSAYGRFEADGEAIASVVRLAWLPFGAIIRGGAIRTEAQGAGALLSLGILGVSGTTYDNDADLFLVAGQDINAAVTIDFPASALAAVGTTLYNKPGNYKVTDPEGAYIIATTAGAVLGTDKDLDIEVKYIRD